MTYDIDFSIATSEQIEASLCKRLERVRLDRNLTQTQLAKEAGVSMKTIGRLEKGEGVSLDTFIRVLIALGIQDNLKVILPDPSVRPVELAMRKGVERKRARPLKKRAKNSTWTWGNED